VTSDNAEGLVADNLKFGDGSLLRQNDDTNDGSEYTDLTTIRYYQRLYGDAWIDLCERSLQRMNDGGSIIGISSPGVNPCLYRPDRTYSGPGSGKAIMEYSMRIYAKVVAPRSINVNVVVPGLVQTPEWQRNTKYRKDASESAQEMMERLVDTLVPMKRLMDPIDMGNVVAFLCSPPGRYITGMTLPVDGGMHIN
jgi:NAD(P)-dependent dehydrogenase (short-subunit alcohol dehydrogenase family)